MDYILINQLKKNIMAYYIDSDGLKAALTKVKEYIDSKASEITSYGINEVSQE